jgi:hypothetical protein
MTAQAGVVYCQIMTGRSTFLLFFGVFYSLVVPAFADYTLILKNGRRITVQSYREEGGTIKFQGLGGEIGIEKDQIQAIRKGGEVDPSALDVSQPAPPISVAAKEPAEEEKKSTPPMTEGKLPGTKTNPAEQKAKEEKAYQERIKELTEQIKKLRDRYALETRGTTGPEPTVPMTDREIQARTDDFISRLRDAQYRAQGLETGGNAGSPPFSLDAPPAYTEKQKELSDLRNQINQLESQRQSLIDEMRQKGFDTGSLFLE